MIYAGNAAALLGLAVVVLVAVVVGLLLVAAVGVGLWISVHKLSRGLDRYAPPKPKGPRHD